MTFVKFFFSVYLLASSTIAGAETESKYTIDKKEWKTFKTTNGVIFSYKIVEYHDNHYRQHKEFYVSRVTNTNNVPMLSYAKKVLWYNDKCFNCDTGSDEYTYYIIQASDKIIGNPMGKKDRKLVIFKRFLNKPNVPKVTKFEFQNLTVNPSNHETTKTH